MVSIREVIDGDPIDYPTIKRLVSEADIEHDDIVDDGDEPIGVGFTKDGYVVEIFQDYIAVKEEGDDDMSWEILSDPNDQQVLRTIKDPSWFAVMAPEILDWMLATTDVKRHPSNHDQAVEMIKSFSKNQLDELWSRVAVHVPVNSAEYQDVVYTALLKAKPLTKLHVVSVENEQYMFMVHEEREIIDMLEEIKSSVV